MTPARVWPSFSHSRRPLARPGPPRRQQQTQLMPDVMPHGVMIGCVIAVHRRLAGASLCRPQTNTVTEATNTQMLVSVDNKQLCSRGGQGLSG